MAHSLGAFLSQSMTCSNLFTYRTAKTVRVRDYRVGATSLLLHSIVALYIVAFEMVYRQGYLVRDPVHAAVQPSLLPLSIDTVSGIKSGPMPAYCSGGVDCVWNDALLHGSSHDQADLLIPTSVWSATQEPADPATDPAACASFSLLGPRGALLSTYTGAGAGRMYCGFPPSLEETMAAATRRNVAFAEAATVRLSHALHTTYDDAVAAFGGDGLSGTLCLSNGTTLSFDGSGSDADASRRADAHGHAASAAGDAVKLPLLLAATERFAEKGLDTVVTADGATLREVGGAFVVLAEYSTSKSSVGVAGLGVAYSVRYVPDASRTSVLQERHGGKVHRHVVRGVRVVTVATGEVTRFSFIELLKTAAAGLVLFGLVTFLVDTVLLSVLPQRYVYEAYTAVETAVVTDLPPPTGDDPFCGLTLEDFLFGADHDPEDLPPVLQKQCSEPYPEPDEGELSDDVETPDSRRMKKLDSIISNTPTEPMN